MALLAMTEVCNASADVARWRLKFSAPIFLENIYQVLKLLYLNKEKGGKGDDSHTSDSCFPGELAITLLRFAGARQREQ